MTVFLATFLILLSSTFMHRHVIAEVELVPGFLVLVNYYQYQITCHPNPPEPPQSYSLIGQSAKEALTNQRDLLQLVRNPNTPSTTMSDNETSRSEQLNSTGSSSTPENTHNSTAIQPSTVAATQSEISVATNNQSATADIHQPSANSSLQSTSEYWQKEILNGHSAVSVSVKNSMDRSTTYKNSQYSFNSTADRSSSNNIISDQPSCNHTLPEASPAPLLPSGANGKSADFFNFLAAIYMYMQLGESCIDLIGA